MLSSTSGSAAEPKAWRPQPAEETSESSMCMKIDPDQSDVAVQPSEVDVLMGRGKRVQNHVGNNKLRSILEDNLAAYTKAPHATKRQVAMGVIEEVKKGGGRFLRPTDSGCWEVADADSVQKKVIHDFRTIRGILKRQRVERPPKTSTKKK
jgi:hypothetical protein